MKKSIFIAIAALFCLFTGTKAQQVNPEGVTNENYTTWRRVVLQIPLLTSQGAIWSESKMDGGNFDNAEENETTGSIKFVSYKAGGVNPWFQKIISLPMLLFPEDEPAGILFKVKITNNYTNHDGGADDGDYGIRRFRLYAHFNSEDLYNRWTTIDIEKNIELPLYAEDGAFVYVPFTDFKYDVGNQLAWDAGALLRIGFYWQYQNTTDNNEDIIVELQDLMIVGEVASGIQTISESKLKVYADESSVHLSNAIANDRIEIFNAQGQKMYSGCAIEGKNSIPFNQSKGLYMLKLKDKIVKFIR